MVMRKGQKINKKRLGLADINKNKKFFISSRKGFIAKV